MLILTNLYCSVLILTFLIQVVIQSKIKLFIKEDIAGCDFFDFSHSLSVVSLVDNDLVQQLQFLLYSHIFIELLVITFLAHIVQSLL